MIRVAVLGTGDLFARTLLPRLDADGPYRVVAHFGDAVGPGVRCPTPEAAIERADVDAVWLLGPGTTHASQALRAIAAGKHVYVQKPLGTTPEEIDAVVEKAERSRVKIVVAPAQAAYPTIRRLNADLREVGPFFFAVLPMMGWGGREIEWPRDPSWRFAKGAGPLTDHGVYGVTTLLELLGPVRRVVAMGEVRVPERRWRGNAFPVEEQDNTAAILELVNGGYATLHEAWCPGAPGAGLRLHGLEGTITAYGGLYDACPQGYVVRGVGGEEIRHVGRKSDAEIDVFFADGVPNPHVWADVRHLAECIEEDRESLASPARARAVYRILDAIREAARTGQEAQVTA